MKKIITLTFSICALYIVNAQTFTRTQLSTSLTTPWEMTYGPDGYLWITDSGGVVLRVNPATGAKSVVYTAPDYYGGSVKEQLQLCFKPMIGTGTLGLALHPDFMNASNAFIYYVYSYNSSGDTSAPATRFKIVRLQWQASSGTVIANKDIVTDLPTGYDHLGGRLMVIPQGNTNYLFFSAGDNGISETNSPTCYSPQSNNPNNRAQDPAFKNGKIHRFNLDGSIPSDNPISGNSFYTRGHRNPQGLIYNPMANLIYDVEHGDRSDDEINVLEKGMNYGWKYVRGYHGDNNFPGEDSFINNYTPDPAIANDMLKPAFFSWCAVAQPTDNEYLNWCTVAPSDGIYYGSNGIPEWTNSLLVVTLKNGPTTDPELFMLKLNSNGSLADTSGGNKRKFFGSDKNGRLRDVAVSADGKKIFVVNNNNANTKDTISITVYTYNEPSSIDQLSRYGIRIHPNPASQVLHISAGVELASVEVYNLTGEQVFRHEGPLDQFNISAFSQGIYMLKLTTSSGQAITGKFIKQ